MFSSRLFWKLMLVCAGLNIVAAVVIGVMLSAWQQQRLDQQIDARLRDAARLLRSQYVTQLQDVPADQLQERIRTLGRATDIRLTLVDRDGTVLADSLQESPADLAKLENHRDRPEIARAWAVGEGAASRSSSSLDAPFRYFALRIDDGDEPVGVIRTALPVASIESQAATMRNWIWGLVAAVAAGGLTLLYWAVRRIVEPVALLTGAAEAIAAGDYQHRVYVTSRDELGRLARTFNRMSQEFGARMAQLSETSDRQATVLGGMIEGVIAVDGRQRIVLANQAAGKLFDFRPPAAEGRPLLEVVRNHALHEAVTTALATGQPQRLDTNREGARQWVDTHVQPLPGSPCPGVVLVMHDTTELRRLESLRRDFIANVSHELKTPLTSIKAYTETLRNGAVHDPETGQKFLARIEEQAERLHRLIVDMLMLARIESDQQAFEIVPVNVADMVAKCLDDRRPTADAKRIHLAAEPNLPMCSVRADREGLREILDNLIDNAIKYTPEGGRVTVSWCHARLGDKETGRGGDKETGRQGDEEYRTSSIEHRASSIQHPGSGTRHVTPDADYPAVTISVRDTGIGIKPEDLKRVFERFYRVDKARSRELGGTGLGLSIVKHLVQSFGGQVGVNSEPGKGSVFTVSLPLA